MRFDYKKMSHNSVFACRAVGPGFGITQEQARAQQMNHLINCGMKPSEAMDAIYHINREGVILGFEYESVEKILKDNFEPK